MSYRAEFDVESEVRTLSQAFERLSPEDQEWIRLWYEVPATAVTWETCLKIAREAPYSVREAIMHDDHRVGPGKNTKCWTMTSMASEARYDFSGFRRTGGGQVFS